MIGTDRLLDEEVHYDASVESHAYFNDVLLTFDSLT